MGAMRTTLAIAKRSDGRAQEVALAMRRLSQRERQEEPPGSPSGLA